MDDTPLRIGLKTDVESLTDNVYHLIGGYNDFVRAATSYLETQTRSRQLVKEMKGIASVYGESMESMGLNLENDGTLAVDKDTLRETASQSDDINELPEEFLKYAAAQKQPDFPESHGLCGAGYGSV